MSWHTLGSCHGGLEVTLAASSMVTRDSILIGSGLVASLVFVLTVYVVTIRQTASVWTALVRRFPATEWPAGCKWHGAGALSLLTRERRIVKLWLQDVESGPGSYMSEGWCLSARQKVDWLFGHEACERFSEVACRLR